MVTGYAFIHTVAITTCILDFNICEGLYSLWSLFSIREKKKKKREEKKRKKESVFMLCHH